MGKLAWLDANSSEEALENGAYFIRECDREARFYEVQSHPGQTRFIVRLPAPTG